MKFYLYSFIIRRYTPVQLVILFLWNIIIIKLFGVTSVTYSEGWTIPPELFRAVAQSVAPEYFPPAVNIPPAWEGPSTFASDLPTFSANEEVKKMVDFLTEAKTSGSKTPYIDLLTQIFPTKDHAMFAPDSKEAKGIREQMLNELYEYYYEKCHRDPDPRVTSNRMVHLITSFLFYSNSVNEPSTMNMDVKTLFKFIPTESYDNMTVIVQGKLNDYVEEMNKYYKDLENYETTLNNESNGKNKV